MSLFEDPRYHWRETYFVLFDKHDRPAAAAARRLLASLGARVELQEPVADKTGRLESLTILAPGDGAGMDISYLAGDEVAEQVAELKRELRSAPLSPDEKAKFERLLKCNARFDVYHFQELGDDPEEMDEALDPGSLLLVLDRLAKLCQGVAIDPQSGSLL